MKLIRNFFILTSMALCAVASLTSASSASTILSPFVEFSVSYIEPFPEILEIEQSTAVQMDKDRSSIKAPDVGKPALVNLPDGLRSRIEHAHASNCDRATRFSKLSFEVQNSASAANPKLDNRL